jgi:signal transduction histidine kinase
MCGMTIITGLIHGKLWKPFYKTISLTEHFNIQHNKVPDFPSSGTYEFDQLNRALTSLMGNNLKAYKIQKEFTENASHEMQTPLAIFRSKLDILLQQSGLTKEQLQIIQTLNEAGSRLVRMNKNLLLLAKMDNLQYPDTQTLIVFDVLDKSLSFLLEQTEAANITLETQFTDRTLTLQANKMLLESLINNLLTNAIRHNVPGGKILIKLDANRLTVLNTGPEHPLDNTQLFRRFGQMSTTTQGSRLGLAIVQQICSHYGWQIDYGFENGMHHFEVKFHV